MVDELKRRTYRRPIACEGHERVDHIQEHADSKIVELKKGIVEVAFSGRIASRRMDEFGTHLASNEEEIGAKLAVVGGRQRRVINMPEASGTST